MTGTGQPTIFKHMPADLNLRFESSARVAVSLETAGLGNRALAYLADLAIVATAWFTVLFTSTYLFDWLGSFVHLSGMGQALVIVAGLLLTTGYDIFFETFMDGQSPGKRLVGLRVVRTDGGRVGVVEAALRNLLRAIDLLPIGYGVGILTMAIGRGQRRLGDIAAGCVVIRERPHELHRYREVVAGEPKIAAELLARARRLELSPTEYSIVIEYLARRHHFTPAARRKVAAALAGNYITHLLPDHPQDRPVDLKWAEWVLVVIAAAGTGDPA